jgi:hypothetical protein
MHAGRQIDRQTGVATHVHYTLILCVLAQRTHRILIHTRRTFVMSSRFCLSLEVVHLLWKLKAPAFMTVQHMRTADRDWTLLTSLEWTAQSVL